MNNRITWVAVSTKGFLAGSISSATERLNVAVARERQHSQQVSMGTLFFLHLHLPHEIITAITVTVTSNPFLSLIETSDRPLLLPGWVCPISAPGLCPRMQCWGAGWPLPSPSAPLSPSSPPSPPAVPPCCSLPGASWEQQPPHWQAQTEPWGQR